MSGGKVEKEIIKEELLETDDVSYIDLDECLPEEDSADEEGYSDTTDEL